MRYFFLFYYFIFFSTYLRTILKWVSCQKFEFKHVNNRGVDHEFQATVGCRLSLILKYY